MTQPIADKTPIPDETRRRHTDPPGLWISVAAISVTLHLLLFWLLRSYSSSLLSQKSSANPIPVDFVEISSPRKAPSKAKPVSPIKPTTTTGKSSVARSPKPPVAQENLTANTSTVEDSNAIALGGALPIALPTAPEGAIAFTNTQKARTSQPPSEDTTQQSSKRRVVEQEAQPSPQPITTSQPTRQPEPTPSPQPPEQVQPKPEPQPTPEVTPQAQQPPTPEQAQPEPTLQPTPEVTPQAQQPQPTPEPTTLADNPDTQNQANQELGEQNQASNPPNNTTDSTGTDSSPETTEPQPPNESTATPSSFPKPDGNVAVGGETPSQDITPPVKPEQSPPLDEQKGRGVGVATWDIQADKLKRDIPENLAQPEDNSRQKELNIVLPDAAGDFQPVDFLVWLTIDQNGTLIFIKVDNEIPLPQRSQYQKYADEIFQGQKFVAATDKDPATGKQNPRPSHLPVRVRINSR